MLNQAMLRKLKTGEACDVSGYEREGGYYVFPSAPDEVEYCDATTEDWIRSIGRRRSDGVILASTAADLYQNINFDCLWLR